MRPMHVRLYRRDYLSVGMKREIQRLISISERSAEWIIKQALFGLLRDIQNRVVTKFDLVDAPGRKPLILNTRVEPWVLYRIEEIEVEWGIGQGTFMRCALARYLSKRALLLSGEKEYNDDLMEQPPT